MSHLYKLSCWECNGKWRVNDVTNLTGPSAKWYTPMRILNLSVEEYINLLVYTFNAKELHYYEPTNYLGFCFLKEIEAKRFCNYVNKFARDRQYICN